MDVGSCTPCQGGARSKKITLQHCGYLAYLCKSIDIYIHAYATFFSLLASLWSQHLTGGANGGILVTDVTNASRTMLMDIHTLQWSDEAIR